MCTKLSTAHNEIQGHQTRSAAVVTGNVTDTLIEQSCIVSLLENTLTKAVMNL